MITSYIFTYPLASYIIDSISCVFDTKSGSVSANFVIGLLGTRRNDGRGNSVIVYEVPWKDVGLSLICK